MKWTIWLSEALVITGKGTEVHGIVALENAILFDVSHSPPIEICKILEITVSLEGKSYDHIDDTQPRPEWPKKNCMGEAQ
jgi:hypothetical protein